MTIKRYKRNPTGITLTMENGWIVSIQNGTNNWAGATTSEVWAWSANGERNYPPDGPRGWQTDGEVTTFINEVAAFME